MKGFIKLLLVFFFLVAIISACGDNNSTKKKGPGNEKTTHLGVNFNERLGPEFVRFSELKNSGTTWVRGFMTFFRLYNKYKSRKNWAEDPKIMTYKKLQKHGYKTILNIRYKFNGHNLTIPKKGTTRFNDYMQFTDSLLRVVLPATNVIVTGNEPFIGAPKGAKHSQRLVDFYEAVAKHIHTYVTEHNLGIPIFMGAFTNAYKSSRQNNKAYNELLAFAEKIDWVQGVDMHIHHTSNKQISEAMDYISKRIRGDQCIIITEFSIVGWWAKHRKDNLSVSFKTKYSHSVPDSVKKVWQYLNFALQHPRPLQEWNDWNKMTPWLKARRHYICKAWQIFNRYDKFWLASYSFKLAWGQHFSATTPAWILNSLLVNNTVAHKPNRDAYGRIWYMDDFKAIQKGLPTSCEE